MNIFYVLVGFLLLVVGGEFLVRSSVGLSFKLKLSKMVIGLTVVSFATSAPELLVSLQAAYKGLEDVAMGNIIGSNVANIGLVLGLTAIISSLTVDRDFYRFNWPVMMLFSLALYFLLANDGMLSQMEGIGLVASLCIYLFFLLKRARKQRVVDEDVIDEGLAQTSYFKIFVWLAIGGAALYFGSEFLVKGATRLAESVGISDYVISVTVIAIGTSIPELAASIIAALKKEKAISLGNLIGSNIFNIGSVLGLTAIIKPIGDIDPIILGSSIFWMIGFAAVLLPIAFIPKRLEISRYKGFIIFVDYIIFIGLTLREVEL
jgi:cation:H+ antiporter